MKTIRPPAVAGMFYPADKSELKILVGSLLADSVCKEKHPGIGAIIAPHAGYMYSGKTAAYAYNMIAGCDYQTVVIISPSHREYFPGSCIYDGSAYSTPMGTVDVDAQLREKIVSGSKNIFAGDSGHKTEHALEVHLPFLQSVLKEFKILPVVMGDQHKSNIWELSDKLAEHADERTLIVASSDLSHFHTKEKADNLDSIIAGHIKKFDFEGLLQDLEFSHCEACGGGPIIAAMRAASLMGKTRTSVLKRSDSGDITGDYTEVVGYLSAVIY